MYSRRKGTEAGFSACFCAFFTQRLVLMKKTDISGKSHHSESNQP